MRPEIAEPLASLDQYEIIWLGYPIWWGEEPRIIDTFLESYDLSEKTVIPFCTSGSSGIGTSERNIKALVPIGNQLPGKRFGANADIEQVRTWIDSLDLPKPDSDAMMELEINGTVLTAAFADTPAAQELAEKLRTAPVTLTLHEYGGFEKVGALPWELPRNDVQTVTEAGDIMLYQGNQITVFYHSNAWQYTKLGSITDADAETLAALFGDGDITITISLAGA